MLTKKQKQQIKKIAKKYDLKLLLLFGSQVNGRNKADSDFDVAYLSHKSLIGEQELKLNGDLMDLFNSDKIDQANIDRANPLLMYEISKNSKLLFGAAMDYLEFKAFTFRNFIDSKSLFDLEHFLIEKRHKLLGKLIYGT